MSKKEEEVCQNSLIFVKDLLTGGTVPTIENFRNNLQNFDFNSALTNNLWNFLILKSSEQDSNLRPVTAYIIEGNLVNLSEEVTKLAALHYFQLNNVKSKVVETENSINESMKNFFFEEKVIIKNEPLDELMSWNVLLLKNSSLENLQKAQSFMTDSGLTKYEDVIEPFIQEKLELSNKRKIRP